jgi:hypothetical protein
MVADDGMLPGSIPNNSQERPAACSGQQNWKDRSLLIDDGVIGLLLRWLMVWIQLLMWPMGGGRLLL